jgi:CRISPR-associated endonuclease Cas2
MRYVVAYDIEEGPGAGAHRQGAGALRRAGAEVSVRFECRLETRDLGRLLRRLERELTAIGGAGNVRVYRLCADCYGVPQGVGGVAEGVESEPWIVV